MCRAIDVKLRIREGYPWGAHHVAAHTPGQMPIVTLGEDVTRTSHRSRVVAALASLGLASSALVGVNVAQAETVAPEVNDCIDVPRDRAFEPYGPIEVIDCAEEHNAQVFAVIAYPDDLGAPSTVAERAWGLFGETCGFDNYVAWLGAGKVKLPIQGFTTPRLPTDEEWNAGARWVACSAFLTDSNDEIIPVTGSLPELYAASSVLDWLICVVTPKSGQPNKPSACTTAKAKWLVIGGGEVKGKIGKDYPKDLQPKADAMCAKQAKPYFKKGAKSKAFAGLAPKDGFPQGNPVAYCFILRSDWNGKTS